MATEHNGLLDQSIPQWKRELILRRRAVGRVLPAGSGSVQLTCPSVVAAVRNPEHSVNADFHLRRCASEREETGFKNMRLVEQVNTNEPGVILDLKDLMTYSKTHNKMGEKKNGTVSDKKSSNEFLDEDQLSDSSEEFKYGPGIVSKLKSRYLSLTLRESQGKVRPSLASMRRATSLENILDEEPEKQETKPKFIKNVQPAINGNSVQRCRNATRGNRDSMKRARSVEALMRYDKGLAAATQNRRSLDNYTKIEEENEERIKYRNRLSLEEKELPPPDLVKHTLEIFERSTTKKNAISTSTLPKTKTSDKSISANKPTISPKPVLSKIKQNGANTPIKEKLNAVSPVKEKPISLTPVKEKSITVVSETPPPVFIQRKIKEKSPSPEKKLKDKLKNNETVIAKKPLEEPSVQDHVDGEQKPKPLICSNLPAKNQMLLDLNKVHSYIKQSSPTATSPKSNSENKKIEEINRPISPVLVRAPPSILSSELANNSNSSSSPIMKQVGVIRPIVTNKINSNVTFPSKYPVNKQHSNLTEREIEKNLINKVKSIEQPVTKVIVSLKKSPEECIVNNVNNEGNKQNEEKNKQVVWDKKPNTMVFNFCNRKTVPDYIENDGLILTSKREKPKVRIKNFLKIYLINRLIIDHII